MHIFMDRIFKNLPCAKYCAGHQRFDLISSYSGYTSQGMPFIKSIKKNFELILRLYIFLNFIGIQLLPEISFGYLR